MKKVEWLAIVLGVATLLFMIALIGIGSAFLLVLNGYGA
jgi:hypothetical protein